VAGGEAVRARPAASTLPERSSRFDGRPTDGAASKRWLELTDEIKVTIAAQACMLTLHLDADYYPKLLSILVYPSAFVPVRPSLRPYWQDSRSETVPVLGQSWASGVVVLSWNSVLGGAANVDDGQNVVFHEELRKYYGQDPAAWIGRPGSLQRR